MAIYSNKVSRERTPVRGDVYYADLTGIEQSIGSEQIGRRPVLIIQNDVGNQKSGTTIIAVMTTKIKNHMPTHIAFHDVRVLPCRSVICTEQIKTIDKRRLEDYKGNVGDTVMKKVDTAIAVSMGIKNTAMTDLEEETAHSFEEDELVKRETALDAENHDWIKFAESQLRFFSNVEQYVINLKCEKKELDREIEDILLLIEKTDFNAAQGYKIYKKLKERRIWRKEKIRELTSLEALLVLFNCAEMCEKYQDGLENMKKNMQEIEPSKTVTELMQMVS